MRVTRLPNLLYVGADKAGSTYLSGLLATHPDVFVCPAKDTYYFTEHYDRGLGWYRRQFSGATSQRYVAEVCHDYLYDERALERIGRDLEIDRVLVSVRDPFERAWSAYRHLLRNGAFVGTFAQALDSVPELVDHSRYSDHLPRWFDRYGQERVRVLTFEQLVADREGYERNLWLSLSLDPTVVDGSSTRVRRNEAVAARSLALVRAGKASARALRRVGHPRAVAALKHSSVVRRVVYRSAEAAPEATRQDRAIFAGRIGDEQARLTDLTGLDLGWREQP